MRHLFNFVNQASFRKELRRRQTDSEAVVWAMLRGRRMRGYKFRRQFGIGKYIVDFYCPKLRLVIEIDGLSHDDGERRYTDQIRQKWIESLGRRVIRFSAKDVLSNASGVRQVLLQLMPAPPPPNPSLQRRGTKGGGFWRGSGEVDGDNHS